MTTIVRDLSRLAPEANGIGIGITANTTAIVDITVANSVSVGNLVSAAAANVITVTSNTITVNTLSFANSASRANVRFNATSNTLELTVDGATFNQLGGSTPGFLLMNSGII